MKIMKHGSIPIRKPKTIGEYLAAMRTDKRAALEKLRKAIRAATPKLEKCINYEVPGFRLNEKFLLAFGTTVKHCACYLGSTVQSFREALKENDTSKGTTRFQANNPLPTALVRNLVRARIAREARFDEKARTSG